MELLMELGSLVNTCLALPQFQSFQGFNLNLLQNFHQRLLYKIGKAICFS